MQILLLKDVPKWHPEYHQIDIVKVRKYADMCISELSSGTWVHQTPKRRCQWCPNKTKKGGKWRELYIPSLKDHCIAHIIMHACEPAFMKGMHPHCCGSVPGRGIKRLYVNVRKWFKYDGKAKYFVKLDIRKFFDSIRKDDLCKCFERHIKDKQVLSWLSQIVYSAPSACPVGYYTSPWFANLLLQDLDWFIEQKLYKFRSGKRIKYVKHYLRYIDDMVLIGSSKSDLKKSVHAIQKYLSDHFGLSIKDCWEIKEIGTYKECKSCKTKKCMLDMGGYKFSKDAVILRDGIYLAVTRLARRIKKRHRPTISQALSLMSRVGWSKMCNNYRFLKFKIKPYVNLKKVRRMISNVDKVGKRRPEQAVRD